MKAKTILATVLIALIVIFSLQNAETTEVNILFWTIESSQVIFILGSFILGLLTGLIISLQRKSSSKKKEETEEGH